MITKESSNDLFPSAPQDEIEKRAEIWKNHPDNKTRGYSDGWLRPLETAQIIGEPLDPRTPVNYTLTAALDLERAYGLNLEEELVRYLGHSIEEEMDRQFLDIFGVMANTLNELAPPKTAGEVQLEAYGRSPLLDVLPIYMAGVRNRPSGTE